MTEVWIVLDHGEYGDDVTVDEIYDNEEAAVRHAAALYNGSYRRREVRSAVTGFVTEMESARGDRYEVRETGRLMFPFDVYDTEAGRFINSGYVDLEKLDRRVEVLNELGRKA